MKKSIFTILILSNFFAYGVTLDELKEPMPIMGRFSNADNVENIQDNIQSIKKDSKKELTKENKQEKQNNKAISKKSENLNVDTNDNTKQIPDTKTAETEETQNAAATFADLSLQRLAVDAISELDLDEAKINSDLSILWNATTERSETMKYTIYKLSNPDEDKPNDSTIKKILRPIANITSVAGASVAGDPYMATGALIGGGLVNAFMKDDKEVNYKFSKVSDADMVLLIRKIDELQKKLLDLYVDYRSKEQIYKMTQENFAKREEIYEKSKNLSKEQLTIADVYYRNAKNAAQKANDEFLTSRAILENLVGKDALLKIEE